MLFRSQGRYFYFSRKVHYNFAHAYWRKRSSYEISHSRSMLDGGFSRKERECNETLNRMQVELELISSRLAKVGSFPCRKNGQFSGLELNSMLCDFYLERVIRESNPLCSALVLHLMEKITIGKETTQKGSTSTILQQTKLEQEEREPLIFDYAQAKKNAVAPNFAAQNWIPTLSLRTLFSKVFTPAY